MKAPLKNSLLKMIRRLPMSPLLQESWLFALKLGYWPNLKAPRTFNEKINWRKLQPGDSLIALCSDKIAVREYVAERIGPRYLIPLLYEGASITAEQLHGLGDDIVAKPNHDSKSTEIIRKNSPEIAREAAARLRGKLEIDYGRSTNQFAYSLIQPRILVEKMLVDADKRTPDDYKIFCFRQPDGSIKMYLELHEDREQSSYRASWYDELLNPLLLKGSDYRARNFPCPEAWPEMRAIAAQLARDFDHVRIDLYRVDGTIFFGEMSFFDGGGRTEYSKIGGERHDLDKEMGDCWTLEPENRANACRQSLILAEARC